MNDPRPARQTDQEGQQLKPLALVVCGALMREVQKVATSQGWSVDFFGVPARHHTQPPQILEAVVSMLDRIQRQYEKVVVVYGDCGTAGALDRLLEKRGVSRIPGPHCYEMYAGASYGAITQDCVGTYFVTDYLVRNWEATVMADTDPKWRDSYTATMFAGFEKLVYLQQEPSEELELKAREIANSVNLPLEIQSMALGDLGERLIQVVEGAQSQ
ncbi:MAG: DUF1638 domain-containing protein [Thermoanaerobaculia bacterium]